MFKDGTSSDSGMKQHFLGENGYSQKDREHEKKKNLALVDLGGLACDRILRGKLLPSLGL